MATTTTAKTTHPDQPGGGVLTPEVLRQFEPLSKAPLALSQRSRERAWKSGIRINGVLVKLRVARVGVRVFTTPEWCADFVVACTRAGEGNLVEEPDRPVTSEERARKRHTADVLARHGIAMPDPAGGA